jgi:tetratricopeptide (TPR) repeat protein
MADRVAVAGFFVVVSLCARLQAQDIWATPEQQKPAQQPAAEAPPPALDGAALEAQTYEARVMLGIRQIVMRDHDGAIQTLRRAAELEPKGAPAFCHLGDAELESGKLAEAKTAFETCARFAGFENERYMVLAQVGLARVVEKGPGDVSEKRAAWVRARDAMNEPAAKGLAEARIAAYDAAITREKAHEAVRRRIVERDVAREAAAGQ